MIKQKNIKIGEEEECPIPYLSLCSMSTTSSGYIETSQTEYMPKPATTKLAKIREHHQS